MSDLVPATRDRILEAALLAMGRVGPRRFTMQDVSHWSGLSRGTVYRYFPTKEELLSVLARYEQDRFEDGLRKALASLPDDDRQIDGVAEYILDYLRVHPALTLMIEREPEFAIGFLSRQLPVFERITTDLLEPIMRRTPAVQEGLVSADELNELLLRVVLAVFLVQGEGSTGVARSLQGPLDSLIRLTRRKG